MFAIQTASHSPADPARRSAFLTAYDTGFGHMGQVAQDRNQKRQLALQERQLMENIQARKRSEQLEREKLKYNYAALKSNENLTGMKLANKGMQEVMQSNPIVDNTFNRATSFNSIPRDSSLERNTTQRVQERQVPAPKPTMSFSEEEDLLGKVREMTRSDEVLSNSRERKMVETPDVPTVNEPNPFQNISNPRMFSGLNNPTSPGRINNQKVGFGLI
jgi:hypothetical protein